MSNEPTLDHLHADEFHTPIIMRIRGVTGEELLPTFDITQMLKSEHNLTESTIDTAGHINTDSTDTVTIDYHELAFDANALPDDTTGEDVLEDIFEMIDQYNNPGDDIWNDDERIVIDHLWVDGIDIPDSLQPPE